MRKHMQGLWLIPLALIKKDNIYRYDKCCPDGRLNTTSDSSVVLHNYPSVIRMLSNILWYPELKVNEKMNFVDIYKVKCYNS